MKVSYYLKDATGDKETTIYILCYDKGLRVKIYTPIRLKPLQWDVENQRCRKNFPNYSEANALLKRLGTALDQCYLTSKAMEKALTPELLKATVDEIMNTGIVNKKTKSFLDHCEDWIEKSKSFKTNSTLTIYKATLKHLSEFAKAGPFRLEFDRMDNAFYERFTNYLLQDKGHNNNTIGKYVKTLKTFLAWAYESGLHDKQDFKRFKVYRHDIEVVYLTQEELGKIQKADLSAYKWLEETRDVFLFECQTGLRFSDLHGLRKENISDDYVSVLTQKTSDQLRIPLSPLAKSILHKYTHLEKTPLPVRSNQKTNEYLKNIASLAGINDTIQVTDFKGGKRIIISRPKWELITTHTARRTFVTLALENNIRPEIVMAVTGHKDYRTMKKYIKITDRVIIKELNTLWGSQVASL